MSSKTKVQSLSVVDITIRGLQSKMEAKYTFYESMMRLGNVNPFMASKVLREAHHLNAMLLEKIVKLESVAKIPLIHLKMNKDFKEESLTDMIALYISR